MGKDKVTSICFVVLAIVAFILPPAFAQGYDNSLKNVGNYDVVYEVTQGSPKIVNNVFWAVKNSYAIAEVNDLSTPPKVAIVFHGPAVRLLSSDMSHFSDGERVEVAKFKQTLRQMKADGVNLEVCLYAAKMVGVEKETIIPEIDQVGNGFVSVIGYQMQGYAVVLIP